MLYQANRFNIAGRQYLKTGAKFYVADIGLRNYLLGYRSRDAGRILENIVYLELIRRGWQVFVGKAGAHEVDFVAQRGGETAYYQVAATVRYLLTLDDYPPSSHDGIRQIYALDFLCA